MGPAIRAWCACLAAAALGTLIPAVGAQDTPGPTDAVIVEHVVDAYWERYPKPSGRYDTGYPYSLDETRTLWTIGHRFCFWNGRSFQTPEEVNVPPQVHARSLIVPLTSYITGDATRGLYGVQYAYYSPASKDVFRLSNGTATYLATTPADGVGKQDRLYVTADGRFLHWGDQRFLMYDGGAWREVANNPGPEGVVLEVGGELFVYNHRIIYGLSHDAFAETPVMEDPNSPMDFVGLWGDDTLVFLHKEYGPRPDDRRGGQGLLRSEIRAYRLTSGRRTTLGWEENRPAGWLIADMRRTADGTFWLLLTDGAGGRRLAHVDPVGNIRMLPDVCGFPWQALFADLSPHVLLASDGTVWFGYGDTGVFHYAQGTMCHHDYRQNPSCPVYCASIKEECDGAIYVNSGYWLYALRKTNTPAENAWAHMPSVTPLNACRTWRRDSDRGLPLGRVITSGSAVIAHSMVPLDARFLVVDSVTGQVRSDNNLPSTGGVWAMAYKDSGLVLLLAGSHFLRLDPATGSLATLLAYPRDDRIEPIIVGQDYLLGKGYRSESIFRVSPQGKELWATPLPGYLHTHTSASRDTLLAQTRQSSYGGQATSAIDIARGTLLWSERVDAYGCGTAIDDSGALMVEADEWLSPTLTEGWIIARKPRTGERLWRYTRSVHVVCHRPILDPATRNVYAVFEDGAVVCLAGDTGEVVWETRLLERPFPAPAASYEPYQSCMTTCGDLLSVVDRNHEIYLLDRNTGDVRARFDVTSTTCPDTISLRSDELVCPPAFTNDRLVILTKRKMEAYDVRGMLSDDPGQP